MKWNSVRVSKFTRNLHPDDHQAGLPKPGPLEEAGRYENWLVRRNTAGEWVGGNLIVNNWLIERGEHYAEDEQGQATEVPTTKKKRKPRRKPKPVQLPTVEKEGEER